MASPESLAKLVRSESERLEQYLTILPPEAWTRPSACDGWEIRDVVGHLVFWAEPYTNSILRAVEGDVSTPEGWPPPGSLDWQPLMEFIAETAITCRESLGEQLFETFRSTNDHFNQVLMGLGPKDWDKPSYHPARISPVRTRAEARILELAVHGWDISSRLEPAAHLSTETLPVLSDFVGQRAVNFLGLTDFRLGHKLAEPVRYHFQPTDITSSGYDLVVEDDGCRMEAAVIAPANVTFRSNAETFVLMGLGRLKLESVIAEGQLAVEGDRGLVDELLEWFNQD